MMTVLILRPRESFYAAYCYFGTTIGLFLVSQGLWALCFGRRNPRQVRDVIYSFAKSLRLGFQAQDSEVDNGGSWQKQIAKYIAMIAYFWTVIASVLSVLFFLANIVVLELFLAYLPQSESASHVGAWSPWATTVLVILAALVGKLHKTFVRSNITLIQRAFNKVRQSTKNSKIHGHQLTHVSKTSHWFRKTSTWYPRPSKRLRFLGGVLPSLRSGRDSVISTSQDVEWELKMLIAFWHDPDNVVGTSPEA